MSESATRTKTVSGAAIRKSPWQCPGCGRRELEIRGYVPREVRQAVRNGEPTGECISGQESEMEVEALHCPKCKTTWEIEPDFITKLKIEIIALRHELASMRGESFMAWF